MKYSYFPGCTLKTKAKQLDADTRACAKRLGVTLEELPDWQCCGGVYNTANDQIADKLSAVRALTAAYDAGQPIVTVCSACHNVLKRTNAAMRTDSVFADRANRYLAQGNPGYTPYHGEVQIYHYLELLRDVVGWEGVRAAVKKPLAGRRIGAYYGCLLLRPSPVMAMDDPENPNIIEDLIRALGAEPVRFAKRVECCGGYTALDDPDAAKRQSCAVTENAVSAGADLLVTACPLCRYNLAKTASGLPVVYFTELLAQALGVCDG
ncbi:MAG: disulfide reductase [Ruminococcaceae bacterium]|nr:disulfide reductase [Oscillospiraceae bacterium]